MPEPIPLPDELARGPFDRAALARAGLSAGRARRRDITRPFHGVQTVSPVGTLRGRCDAYCVRMRPGQAFSHQTALRLVGLPVPRAFEEETDLHVCAVLPAPAPTTRNVVGHRLRRAVPVVDLDGLPVVRADEAWAQTAPLLTLDELIELGDALLWRDRGWLPWLDAAAAQPNRPAGDRVRRALREVRAGAASPGETRTRLLLVRAGLPEPELNAEVVLPGGETIHPDLLRRAARVAVEHEGGGHADERQRRYDLGRYGRMHDLGWTVLPITADDLVGAAATALVARLRRLVLA